MFYGKVVGTVVATNKDPRLNGWKLLVVRRVDHDGKPCGDPLVAVDYVQAGRGDFVCLTSSKDAAWPTHQTVPTDAGIMGIIDEVTLLRRSGGGR